MCSLKDSENLFMQSLPLYATCLFSIHLNDDIVNNQKSDGISLATFSVDEFSGLFLLPSVFPIEHSRSG